MDLAELPPLEELLPHRAPVLLLDRVLAHDTESTTVRVSVDHQAWLKHADETVAAWLAVEYMAQCIAAHEGVLARLEGRPLVQGSLAAATGVRFLRSRFLRGEVLRVRARRVRGRPGLGVLSHFCTVHEDTGAGDGQLLAEGRLSTSIPRLPTSSA